MKKFLIGLTILVVLIAALVAMAPMLVPTGAYKGQIETAASSAVGRDVRFGDQLSFKVFPQAAFQVSDLEIANAEGFEGEYLARVKQADIVIKLLPLLQKDVQIKQFVLREPDLNLARSKAGAVNWNLAANAASSSREANAPTQAQLNDLSLGDIRIVDGRAVFTDATAGKTYTAENMNMTATLDSLDKPLSLDGNLVFQGAPSQANVILTTPGAILRNEEANLKLDVVLADASAGADLIVQSGETLSYRGPIRIDAPDLPGFAKLFDVPLEDAPGFDRLALEGEATGSNDGLRIAGANIEFDAIKAAGDLALNWSGAKPKATGSLSTNLLDLRPYMPPPATSAGGFPAWSKAKMDFSSLRNIDADLNIAAEKTLLNEIEIDRSRMKLTIANGRMTADIPEIAMYGGAGSGRLVVNARQATPSFAGNFDLSAVQAQPFSIDMLKTDRLLGLGGLKLNFSASGASQAAIMNSIDGDGSFDLADGALKGFNIAKLVRAAASFQEGFNPAAAADAISKARGPDETTDFSQFLSNFTMRNGQVSAPRISLTGPYLTMSGLGAVNLPNQTVDISLSPRASTSIDGAEGRTIAIPLRITGTFSQPKVAIDAEKLVRGRVESGVRDLIGGVLGGNSDQEESEESGAESAIRGLFGGGGNNDTQNESASAEDGASTEEAIANEALNLLFGADKKKEDKNKNPDR